VAINVAGSGRGGRGSRGLPAMAEINVTPFVDVALVLLIIFMITAHVMESGVEVDVPKTKSVQASSKELPVVTITKAGEIFLGKDPANINSLVADVESKYPGQTAVYLKGDRETSWDIAVNVMSVLGTAKLSVNVVSELDDRLGQKKR
jgi:biopolymer transport protein ExbD